MGLPQHWEIHGRNIVSSLQGQYALAMPMSQPIKVATSAPTTTETPPLPKAATSRRSTPTDSNPAGAIASATGESVVRGKVFLRGSPPPEKSIDMGTDRHCKSMDDAPATTRHYVVNADGTLQNAFVYVKSGPAVDGKAFPVPEEKVVLDQKGCLYHPYVLAVRAGQQLEILNSDDTLHNVHALPNNNPEFNKGQPVKGMRFSHRFDKPEVDAPVKFKCEVHPWMFAWLFVMPHPFYEITGEAGTFEFVGLPAGDYVIAAWHQKAGVQTMMVSLGANESKEVSFDLDVKTPP
jgi:plastocyanin